MKKQQRCCKVLEPKILTVEEAINAAVMGVKIDRHFGLLKEIQGILIMRKKSIVQGITGAYGSLHARNMIAYGTNVVAGVTPGKGGQKFEDKVQFTIQCKKQ